LDRRKDWRAAERLLKQGKVQAALEQLRRISDDAPGGVVTLNRLADLLAQLGKREEAIGYYTKIALQFEQGGFVPKAIAIHKKILRLDPECLDSTIRLGHLYGRQKLHGEARKYLLHAANRYLEEQDAAKAREVFEQLVAAEPDDLRHRVRLAETRAIGGDIAGAVRDLLPVGDALLGTDEASEAAKIFARARELSPEADEPWIGLARCREAEGQPAEALELLEPRLDRPEKNPMVLGEVARMYVGTGRGDEALGLLRGAPVLEIPSDTWVRLFAASLERGEVEQLWESLDPIFRAGAEGGGERATLELLERLGELEPDGHLPALTRVASLCEASGEVRGAVKALDALASAYRARSMDDEAAQVLKRMRLVAPPDEEPRMAAAPEAAPPVATEPVQVARTPADAEAPAVPLNRADEEFAGGRLTQAEVLEKYDLLPQALEQLEEVVARFPGHVVAQQRRVDLLRSLGERGRLPVAVTELALALRAAGESNAAKRAALEATSLPELGSASRRLLERLGLLGTAEKTAPAPSPESVAAVAPSAEPTAASGGETTTEVPESAGEVVIDLDDEDELAAEAHAEGESPAAAGEATGVRTPAPEVLAEVRRELADGHVAAARRRLDALVLLGYSGPELDRLRQEIAAAPTGSAEPESATEPAAEPGEDDDLAAIKSALEAELRDEEPESVLPEESPEQSMEEILQAFKERVDQEVEASDYRMHYELGIGFKEMGLLDEAIRELSRAVGTQDLHREACAMLAVCHRERQEIDEAVQWYCRALEGATADSETARGLRYDLAETLLEGGDAEAALDHFRNVQAIDPTFRDVGGRISQIEDGLQS
jgi:tetratricopeptide (TPR) repeat protein